MCRTAGGHEGRNRQAQQRTRCLHDEVQCNTSPFPRQLYSVNHWHQIQANIDTHRSHIDLRSIHERDNSNIRELLWAIVKSQDDMRLLLNSQSAPVVEEVMENLQTVGASVLLSDLSVTTVLQQLMAPGLQPVEEKDFKAGLWQLHEQTSRLPPLTDCQSLNNMCFWLIPTQVVIRSVRPNYSTPLKTHLGFL